MLCHVTLAVVAAVAFLGCQCSSQLTMRSMLLRSYIKYRFATTVVTSKVINDDATRSQEALFEVILPEEAFIANFSMTVDDVIYPGRVKEKKAAMKEYQEAKQSGQSAGYIKTTARHSNKFDVSVNLEPGSVVTFNLTYQQLLARCHGMYEHKMHVNPGRVVEDLKVEVFLEESRDITKLETSLKKDLQKNSLSGDDVMIVEPSSRSRYIVYKPTREQQQLAGKTGVSGEFEVKYDVERTSPTGEILVVDGYFLHFFAPENTADLTPVPKDIVFVLDISGSMTGTKIAQLKDAMSTILGELSNDDTFNIFSFNDNLYRWKQNLVRVNSDSVQEARKYVDSIQADGSTDINMALVSAAEFLLNNRDRSHVPLIFFLTDGQPTSGTKDPSSIARNVERNNENVASIFGLAFGEGADYELIKIIAVQNSGFARKIYEAADASEQVKGIYDEISNTILQNVTFSYLNGTVDEESVTTTYTKTLFQGNDVVVAGKLGPGVANGNEISGVITATSSKGMVTLILDNKTDMPPKPQPNPYFKMPVDFASVTKKSWAYLSIKDLLNRKKKTIYKQKTQTEDLDGQILKLALEYNFVTPLTSMVATKPKEMSSRTTVEGAEYEKPGKFNDAPRQRYMGSSNVYGSRSNSRAKPSSASGASMPVRHHRRRYKPRRPSRRWQSRRRQGPFTMKKTYPDFWSKVHNSPPMQSGNLGINGDPGLHFTNPSMVKFLDQHTLLPQYRSTTTPALLPQYRSTTTPALIYGQTPYLRGGHGGKNRKMKKMKRKNKRTCRIVKTLLDGFGIRHDNITRCVKVRRVQSGTYMIYPEGFTDKMDIYVGVTFKQGKRKPSLDTVRIYLKGDNHSYSLVFNQTNITSSTWESPASPSGHVTIQKHVTCRGRRGVSKVFIIVHSVEDGRTRRDIRGRLANKKRRMKKKSLVFQQCQGRLKKESLTTKSDRFTSPQYLPGLVTIHII